MASPSRAEIETQWANAAGIIWEILDFGSVNSPNLIGLIDTLEQSFESDWADEAAAAVARIRANIAGAVSPATIRSLVRPFMKQYCKTVIGRTNLQSDEQMHNEIYRYMIDNALKVQSRVFTFNDPAAAGANVGTTQIVRLNRDRYNQIIESQHADAKRARCIVDRNTGTAIGREIWQFMGNSAQRDDLKRSGSGLTKNIAGLTTDDSLITNASWSSFDSASSPTTISGWTSSTTVSSSLCDFDSTNYFRKSPSDGTTAYAINLKLSNTFSQKLSTRNVKLDVNRPYLLAVAWNRAVGSASGTLNIRMGNVTTTVTVAAQTGWTLTTVPSPIGQSAWYRLISEDDLDIQIEWTRTGGSILFDDVLLVPGTIFDGAWYWVLPNSTAAYVAPRVLDEFTWADSVNATTGKIQTVHWRAFGERAYFPASNGSSITWADPS